VTEISLDRVTVHSPGRLRALVGDETRAHRAGGTTSTPALAEAVAHRVLRGEPRSTDFLPALLGFFPPNPWRVFGLFREGVFGGVLVKTQSLQCQNQKRWEETDLRQALAPPSLVRLPSLSKISRKDRPAYLRVQRKTFRSNATMKAIS
jgi:hypothetical protein